MIKYFDYTNRSVELQMQFCYAGPGWYYSDNTERIFFGPHDTSFLAQQAKIKFENDCWLGEVDMRIPQLLAEGWQWRHKKNGEQYYYLKPPKNHPCRDGTQGFRTYIEESNTTLEYKVPGYILDSNESETE
jgi:hypothetical protein